MRARPTTIKEMPRASPANTGTYFTPLKRIRRSKMRANLFRKVENGRSLEAEDASEKNRRARACLTAGTGTLLARQC
jgi:hypothetical protein